MLDTSCCCADSGHSNAAGAPETPLEVELKLLASPAELALVGDSQAIHRHARNKGTTRRFETVYYDTPDRVLGRRGLTLRVRHSGVHYIQTLKNTPDTNPLLRGEWETPVESILPDLARLPKDEIGAAFGTLAGASLVPVFTTKVRRHQIIVDLPDAVVEVALDEGTIEAGGRSEALSEVELELKSGHAGALYELGLSLLDTAPLRFGASSKSARGYALAFGVPPKAVKAAPVDIEAEDNVDEAIAKLLRNCHSHLTANLAAAEGAENPEAIHQMRVALRRLRAALSIVQHAIPAPSLKAVGEGARRLARVLGTAREWDVFVTETLSAAGNDHLPDADLALLRQASVPLRAKSHGAVRKALADPRTNRFLLSLGRLIERRGWRDDVEDKRLAITSEPAKTFAGRTLARIVRKALARGDHFRHITPEARHRLRLNLKKLRYVAEFFSPLYAGRASAKEYIKRLRELQDRLGADNDVSASRALLNDIGESTAAPDVHRAIAALTERQAQTRRAAEQPLYDAWHSFKEAAPFWQD